MPHITNWESLSYSFVEYIPRYGTFYSFQRSRHAQQDGDETKFWLSTVNFVQGIARDALLYFEFVEPISVVVIHAMAESASDGWADLMTDNPHIHTGYKLEGMPKRDKEHVNVLITGKTIRHAEDVYNYKLNTSTFLAVLRLHMAVFMGKLNMPYARNENFFLVFPEGLRNTGLCYVLSTFTTDARAVANRPLTSISPRIRMISELEFELKSDGSTSEYYWFVGTFTEQGSRIRLEMHGPSGVAAVISLERQLKSTA